MAVIKIMNKYHCNGLFPALSRQKSGDIIEKITGINITYMKKEYTEKHAKMGLKEKLPKIECFPNQFKSYEITIEIPEYTSVCPRSGLPDFGKITIHYMPDKLCVELKSLKYYILGYRNLGIFYENAVNRILKDFVKACRPKWAMVKGEFNIRGGMKSTVEAKYPR